MKTCIFITARYHSSRLQLKQLHKLVDHTATDVLIERLKKTKLPIVMCTPGTREDAEFMKAIASWHNIGYFAGNNNNIIERHYNCALTHDVDYIVNIDGDDILTCPETVLTVANVIESTGFNVVTTEGLPLGMNVFAYNKNILGKINFNSDTGWGERILDNDRLIIKSKRDCYDMRLTMDYDEDVEVITDILINCKNNETVSGIIDYLDKHPETVDKNKSKNDGYWERYNKLKKVDV